MGQSRDAQRLQHLVSARVRAAALVDRPKGFLRAVDGRIGAGTEVDATAPPTIVKGLEARLDPASEDDVVDASLHDGLWLAATDQEVLLVDRSRLSGRPRSIIRREAVEGIRVRWLDEERQGLRSRFLLMEFGDGRWTLLATPWKRLVPDDVVRLVDILGDRARRLSHPEVDDTRT